MSRLWQQYSHPATLSPGQGHWGGVPSLAVFPLLEVFMPAVTGKLIHCPTVFQLLEFLAWACCTVGQQCPVSAVMVAACQWCLCRLSYHKLLVTTPRCVKCTWGRSCTGTRTCQCWLRLCGTTSLRMQGFSAAPSKRTCLNQKPPALTC
jgi:hypothetical protein